MGFLDLVKQHHGVGPTAHGLGELAPFVKAHIARRRTDQLADGMALHELRHIKANHRLFAAKEVAGQGLGELRFTHASGTGEDKAGDRAVGILQPHPGAANSAGNRLHRLILTDQALVQRLLHIQ